MTLLTETHASLKRKIDRLLDEADAAHVAGMSEEDAARDVLVAQTTDVYRELAVAAMVAMLRRRDRNRTLQREREAAAKRAEREEREKAAREASPEYAQEREQHAAEMRAIDERMLGRIKQAIESYTESLRMEWTQELLASGFVLSDGSKVTWGEASVRQHRDRLTTFTRLAVANAEGAARHQSAIKALEESGARNLNAMVGAVA